MKKVILLSMLEVEHSDLMRRRLAPGRGNLGHTGRASSRNGQTLTTEVPRVSSVVWGEQVKALGGKQAVR